MVRRWVRKRNPHLQLVEGEPAPDDLHFFWKALLARSKASRISLNAVSAPPIIWLQASAEALWMPLHLRDRFLAPHLRFVELLQVLVLHLFRHRLPLRHLGIPLVDLFLELANVLVPVHGWLLLWHSNSMTDSLAPRGKFGVLAPSTNTSVQPEFDAMRPWGVTQPSLAPHHSRHARSPTTRASW